MRPVTRLIHGRPHDLKMAQDHGVDAEPLRQAIAEIHALSRDQTKIMHDQYDVWWGRAAEWCMRTAWRVLWSWR